MGVVTGLLLSLRKINLQGFLGLAATVFLAGILVVQSGKLHDVRADLQTTTTQLATARQTIINYQQAAEKARRDDAANKARAEAEQKANIERTVKDYEARIADARARAERLRHDLNAANSGGARTSGLPVNRPAPEGAAPASPDRGLSIDERLVATEQAIQLNALIDYVEGLLKVDLNGQQPAARSDPPAGTAKRS